MLRRPTTAGRALRPAVVVCLLLALVGVGGPAGAAGTGGIEVTPLPTEVDGEPVTSFRVDVPSRGDVEVPYLLRNVEDGERSARLYIAAVNRSDSGAFSLRDPGSSPYVSMPDETVTLTAGESREESFTVQGGDLPDEQQLAAVVVEVRNGSVVQRASTLIYLEPGRRVPLPLLIVLVAVAVLTAAALAWAVFVRRRRRQAATP